MQKLNILNLNHIGGKTGSAQFIDTLMSGLPADEFNYHTVVGYKFRPQANTTSLYQTSDTRLYRTLRYKSAVGVNFLFDWMTPGCITFDYLHRFKPYQEADIIHLHCPQGGYFDRRDLPKICEEKTVVMTMHDDRIVSGNDSDNLFHPYKTKAQYLKRRAIFQQCKMTFIGVSNWITNKVLKDGINGENEVKTIYNGINTSVFYKKDKKQMRDLLGLPQDKKIIISLAGSGSKTNAKGLGYVQQVIKAYEHHPDYLFLTLGNAKETRVSSSLLELGYVSQEEVAQYLNASDVFLYPTLMDSFGLIIAESLACSCPVVAFATGGVPEIVVHKKTGYVAKRKDYVDLLEGFERVLSQPSFSPLLDSKFTQEAMVKQYVELYEGIFQKKN